LKENNCGASKMIRQRYENGASITLPTSQQPVDWTVGLPVKFSLLELQRSILQKERISYVKILFITK